MLRPVLTLFVSFALLMTMSAQSVDDVHDQLADILTFHREFVSLPNVSDDHDDMMKNVAFVRHEFEERGFDVRLLESTSLPVFLAERVVDPSLKTVLFYFHLDGQPVNAANWDQPDPFTPVLKEKREGEWTIIDWDRIEGDIDPEWRVFGRAAADDKGPITMMLYALSHLQKENISPAYNIKIILDLQEEVSSHGFLSTLEDYKKDYAADYMIIMDGPAHHSNRPTLTFGCRGIVTCSITTYGAKLPQHSGHYGNYAPNPVFSLAHILSSMKDRNGRVAIPGYYHGIHLSDAERKILTAVPDDQRSIKHALLLHRCDGVAHTYQEALQYPSLNVRHIETSWKGPGLKTIIPEVATAHIDVRLVSETDGDDQIEKIKSYLISDGYHVIDHDPTDEERLAHPDIVKFLSGEPMNAFRTDMDSEIGQKLNEVLVNTFGEEPVRIRSMGGTVPIIPAVTRLKIPAIIVPMVNMDNNQHNPNENMRIGNIVDGIRMCSAILQMSLD